MLDGSVQAFTRSPETGTLWKKSQPVIVQNFNITLAAPAPAAPADNEVKPLAPLVSSDSTLLVTTVLMKLRQECQVQGVQQRMGALVNRNDLCGKAGVAQDVGAGVNLANKTFNQRTRNCFLAEVFGMFTGGAPTTDPTTILHDCGVESEQTDLALAYVDVLAAARSMMP